MSTVCRRISGQVGPVARTLVIGGVAGVAVGAWDLSLAAVTQDAPVAAAAGYTMAVTTLAGLGISVGVALLLVLGRAVFGAGSPRMAVVPVGLAAGVIAALVNRGLFAGPGISEASWAPVVEAVFGPLLGVVATALILWVGACASWSARRRLLLAVACVLGFFLFGLANLGYGPFGRFNAYPSLKIEFTLLTWVSAFGALGLSWGARPARPRRDALLAASLILVSGGVGVVQRGAVGIHRVRAQIANLPMPAARQQMHVVESVLLEWARDLPEIPVEDMEVPGFEAGSDRTDIATLLDAQLPNRRQMNVLWIAVDALRQDRLGCYGYARRTTPRIDAFAQDAVKFSRALTPTPASAMAYSSTLSGVPSRVTPSYVHVHGVDAPVPDDFPLASVLAASGRQTMGVTAFFKSTQLRPEFVSMGRGFERFNSDGHIKPLDAREVTDRVVALLAQRRARDPFFIFAHYLDPHAPYQFKSGHDFGARPVDAYDSEIAFADSEIGRLLDKLEELGLSDQTIVCFFSDHGESFGEHNNWRHGGSLYQHQVAVPLLIRVPGLPARTVSEWVTLADLCPTTLSLLEVPDPHRRLGRDLAPLMIGADDGWVDFAYVDRPHAPRRGPASRERGVWSGDRKLVWNVEANTYQVFDLVHDPGETSNLFDPADPSQRRLLGLMGAFDRRIAGFWGEPDGPRDDAATAFAAAVGQLESATADTADAAIAALFEVFAAHRLTLETREQVRAEDRDRLRKLAEGALGARRIRAVYRDQVASVLLFCDDARSMERLVAYQEETRNVALAAQISQYRRRHGRPGVATWMAGALERTAWDRRLWPAYALATVGDESGVPLLRACLRSPELNDVLVAADGLGALGKRDVLLHALLAQDRFWRSERALAPLVDAAGADRTSTGTAFLLHVASSVTGAAARRAKGYLEERLDGAAIARSGEVYLAAFGAKEALLYGQHRDALTALQGVNAKDDALLGPLWLLKLHAALGAGDEAAFDDAAARLAAACPGDPTIQRLARRVRGPDGPFVGEAKALRIKAELVELSADEKPQPGGVILIQVDVTNEGDRVLIGGPVRGSLRFGLVERVGKRLGQSQHMFDLPMSGIAPGETVRVSAVGRLPNREGSHDISLVIRRAGVPGPSVELVRLPTVVVDP